MEHRVKYLLLIWMAGLWISLPVQAQDYSTQSKKAIKYYQKASEFFKARRFDEGIEMLVQATKADDNFAEAHYQLGATYMMFKEHDKSIEAYQKTVEVNKEPAKFQNAYYELAKYHMQKGEYPEALALAEKFMSFPSLNPEFAKKATRIVRDAKFSLENIKNPLDFESQDLPAPLNEFYLQYFPVLTGDQEVILFTARANPPGSQVGGDEDLYVSYFQEGSWTKPESVSEYINTPQGNEGTATLSADGTYLVFTACRSVNPRDRSRQCDLYLVKKQGDAWGQPQRLPNGINTRYYESQPSLSSDGRTLYFISNRPGGKGALDIWYSSRDEAGNWQEAQNMEEVNSTQNDVCPFIHPNGRSLFFASEGYPGFGGYDLYKSEWYKGTWEAPKNLGYPMNNYEDQELLFISADWEKGYYTESTREGNNYTKSVLKEVIIPDAIKPKNISNYVKGYVYDAKTNNKLNAQIDLFDLSEDLKQASVTSDAVNGNYLLVLNQGSEYALEVHKKGYAFKSLTFNYEEERNPEPVVINIALEPIAKGTVFRLNNIFFDYNSFDLQDKSKAELDELVQFMSENPEVQGEISGHTDNTGSAENNKVLSSNRAKSVYDYLVKAGVEASRLRFEGYGSSRPSASNDTEEGRAQNRRIEFKILELKQ